MVSIKLDLPIWDRRNDRMRAGKRAFVFLSITTSNLAMPRSVHQLACIDGVSGHPRRRVIRSSRATHLLQGIVDPLSLKGLSTLTSILHHISSQQTRVFHKGLQHNLFTLLKDMQQGHLRQATRHKAMVPPSQAIQDHLPKHRTTSGRSKHTKRAKLEPQHLLIPIARSMEHRRHLINSSPHFPLQRAQASKDTARSRRKISHIVSTTRTAVQLSTTI